MSKQIVLLAALLAVAASSAFAQTWLSVKKDFDSVDEHTLEVLVDESSVRANAAQPNLRTATVKYIRTAPHSEGKPAARVAYSITVKSFQCAARRIRLDHSEVHFPDGSLQFVDPKGEGAWHTPHDPAARRILDIVCAPRNPKSE